MYGYNFEWGLWTFIFTSQSTLLSLDRLLEYIDLTLSSNNTIKIKCFGLKNNTKVYMKFLYVLLVPSILSIDYSRLSETYTLQPCRITHDKLTLSSIIQVFNENHYFKENKGASGWLRLLRLRLLRLRLFISVQVRI